jgi:hypothetical protein
MSDAMNNNSGSGNSAQPQGKGVGMGTSGRGDQDGDENSGGDRSGSNQCHPRKAGVIIRAFVEHVGLVGDTEMTVNVKWPASTFCVQPCAKPHEPASPKQDTQCVPGNGPLANISTLYGESIVDPVPAGTLDRLLEEKAAADAQAAADAKLAAEAKAAADAQAASAAQSAVEAKANAKPKRARKT